jgi:hypothetical protein
MEQPAGLIGVLIDNSPTNFDRDDAARDLGKYDEPEAEAALLRVVTDPSTDPDLAETSAESLAEIVARRDSLNVDMLRRLPEAARRTVVATIRAVRPEWSRLVQDLPH